MTPTRARERQLQSFVQVVLVVDRERADAPLADSERTTSESTTGDSGAGEAPPRRYNALRLTDSHGQRRHANPSRTRAGELAGRRGGGVYPSAGAGYVVFR